MQHSSLLDVFMKVGLYSLWLIPVFGVYAYFRIFVDRYTIALKNTQNSFNARMIIESDMRRTRVNMGQMSQDSQSMTAVTADDEDIRGMTPDKRILYCLDKGMILNLPVPLQMLQSGQVTGADTVSGNGEVLLVSGSYLTKESIAQLERLNANEIMVMFHPENPTAKRLLA